MKYIKSNWLIIIITILPLLDIFNYFFITSKANMVLTVARFLIMPAVFLISFLKSESKKKYYIYLSVVFIYTLCHCISCYISGYINIIEDLENMLRILYLPTLLFSFSDTLKTARDEQNVRAGLSFAFAIIILSIIISFLTGDVVYTYDQNIGINGWFYNKNTQSLIVVMLSYICAMYSLKGKLYYPLIIIIGSYLFLNGTKTSYAALIILLLMLSFYCIFELKNIKKTAFTVGILVISLVLFDYTPMMRKLNIYNYAQNEKNISQKELIDIIDIEKKEDIEEKEAEKVKKNKIQAYILLYKEYDLGSLINKFGIKNVLKKYNYSTDAFDLSNVRKKKKITASLIYDEEAIYSHFFGFEFTKIKNLESDESLDLETDLSAIFYYTGYIGFALYIAFLCYYLISIFKSFINNPILIIKGEYTVWIITVMLMLSTTELTGALLRRPNASIYFVILIAIAYNKIHLATKDKENKITFLNLHLGYGGIETATINTANALSKKYNVEIISFYNLKNNQESLIDNNVSIKHLYNGEPNREKVIDSIRNFKVFSIIKEGITATKILFLKMKSYILLFLCLSISQISSYMMGIDLGSEFFKVTVIKPGKPFMMLENLISKTKTELSVGLKDDEITYAYDALAKKAKSPANIFNYFSEFLGRKHNESFVKEYMEKFYQSYNITADNETETITFNFKYDKKDEQISVVELYSMIFDYIKMLSERFTKIEMTDAFITIPSFFDYEQR